MTDYLADTPILGRSYCPQCEPDADPLSEILDTRYCENHTPARDGSADELVISQAYMSGSSEAGGCDNTRWCDYIHRGIIRNE